LQRIDQQPARACALHAIELVRVDHHHRVASVQRDSLRAVAVRPAHELAEAGFGILKRPRASQRLHAWLGLRHFFSGHDDQNSRALHLLRSDGVLCPRPHALGIFNLKTAVDRLSSCRTPRGLGSCFVFAASPSG
jgi:hypothetical protein